MKIMVIGLGYVGSVVAAGLASEGNQVTGVDIDLDKIKSLRENIVMIKEPGLQDMIVQASGSGNLVFSHTSEIDFIRDPVIFVCVDTPYLQNAGCDVSQVYNTIEWIKQKVEVQQPILVMKSTVVPGTGEKIIQNYLCTEGDGISYVMNPEFLREGQALWDWAHPDRTVIGSNDENAIKTISSLYSKIEAPFVITDVTTAEMIKYAANAYLATRISFINEIAMLCERFNADIDIVARGMGLDQRIGLSYLRAGIGYGGSCFPKDTRALHDICNRNGIDFELLDAVISINNKQCNSAINKLKDKLGSLQRRRIAVLGLSFKPDTDDVRESPALKIIRLLYEEGADITAYDPLAIENAAGQLPADIKYTDKALNAVDNAHAVLVVTAWREFVDMDWATVKSLMSDPYVVIDGRNCLDYTYLRKLGFYYSGFGRK
ncbi:MAG: UDP-glucose/GDP-mannose dehydrogenase family protein [Dehalococcoidales bacterium]|nr:UDP-glucose/GDP-mannose dehydrogenase family protein [Dehalococcoidales bacterium]